MTTPLEQIDAVTRQITSREHNGQEAKVLTAIQSYPAEIEDVWDALTTAERIPRWFLPISGDLEVGGRYQLEGNAGGVVESCDPPKHFAVTWEMGPMVSWLEVTIKPGTDDGETTVVLEHIAHVDDDLWREYGPGAVGVGWDSGFLGLASHLGTGAGIDPTNAQQWIASDEGKAFMARSSDAWCAASIAAGTDAAEAREAAARTTEAYTAPPEQ